MSDDLIKRDDVIEVLKDLQNNHLQFCLIPFRQAIERVQALPFADRNLSNLVDAQRILINALNEKIDALEEQNQVLKEVLLGKEGADDDTD